MIRSTFAIIQVRGSRFGARLSVRYGISHNAPFRIESLPKKADPRPTPYQSRLQAEIHYPDLLSFPQNNNSFRVFGVEDYFHFVADIMRLIKGYAYLCGRGLILPQACRQIRAILSDAL